MEPSEAIADFIGAMEADGVRPVEPIAQALGRGGIVRFRAEGDKPGRRNGWALLYLDGKPAGAFGCYRLGVRAKWRADSTTPIDPQKRARLEREWRLAAQQRELKRQAAQRTACGTAASLWASGGAPSASHPYLVRKGLDGEGLRQAGDTLLVPMRDVTGALWNVQRIRPDGFKLFLKGGRIAGLFCLIGGGGRVLCLGEGWATMAAVRAATGHPVGCTFTAENLGNVARIVRRQWPGLDLVICADDDAHLVDHPGIKRNLGLEFATAAAAAVRARLAVPPQGGG